MSAVRFTVTKTEDDPMGESSTDPPAGGPADAGTPPDVKIVDSGENKTSRENEPLTESPDGDVIDKHMALYEDEFHGRPKMAQLIHQLANYEGGVEPNVDQEGGDDDGKKKVKSSKLGTVLGVYFPCIQNIFGVILFIRLVWVVGVAGWLEAFFIVFICCTTTMTTAISMSAVATNGVVPAGGSYFLISRALGPEFGGAVGVLFYLGTSVASSMYIVGAVEILLLYMAPQITLFGDITDMGIKFNNYRLYGTILLIIMFFWVFLGVKFVSKFSPIALFCVVVSILSIYIGIFAANGGPEVCMVGERIMSSKEVPLSACNDSKNGTLFDKYCGNVNETQIVDFPNCYYFQKNPPRKLKGIPGLASGVFIENTKNRYMENGQVTDGKIKGDKDRGEIIADITSSFVVLLAIFFPSCTGIMAGSNRSGDLADASKSIPTGTIAAIATTSIVYLSSVLFFGATIEGALLRDKFGDSIDGGLVVANLAWPNPWVILIGSFLSTVGAGLQSLTGAPRLLQAIAADGVIPFLNVFSVTTKKGEPLRALLLTAAISEIGVLIANLDYIAPIITMFFLMCYGFVNLACVVQSLLKTPNWRPRFRFYHWTLSLFGVMLCVALMFISSWYYALAAIAIAIGIYKYIEYKGAEKEWGDGIRGLAMSAARYSLHRLEEGPPHVKNWRPQILILLKLNDQLEPKYRKMLSFSSQLKAGKGLTLVTSVIEGNIRDKFADSQAARQAVIASMKAEKSKGFSEVLVTPNVTDGLNNLIQTSGVGGLRHNTVVIGWPYGWRQQADNKHYKVFIECLRSISHCQLAVLIPKGIDQFPENNEKMTGTIDIWWIVHDGGLLMLLPFLLTQHKVWKNCKMRIFTVAQMEDNSIQMKKDLQTFLYHLRLNAEVAVVEMPDQAISAYTYERTLMMEQRTEILKEMRKASIIKPEKMFTPQSIVDDAHKHVPVAPPNIEIKVDGADEEEESESQSDKDSETKDQKQKDENEKSVPAIITTSSFDNEENGDVQEMKETASDGFSDMNQFTFTPNATGPGPTAKNSSSNKVPSTLLDIKPNSAPNKSLLKPDSSNVRRMHTAVRLNEAIVEKSHAAKLVILNLPGPPKHEAGEQNYMEYLEVLTEGLDRVLMVRGGGREVITIYS